MLETALETTLETALETAHTGRKRHPSDDPNCHESCQRDAS
ncbi:hypothetical protein [Paraburkholderia dinghuensis]|nr:hypothetical protein [Paraburkholderia dinghuensis]